MHVTYRHHVSQECYGIMHAGRVVVCQVRAACAHARLTDALVAETCGPPQVVLRSGEGVVRSRKTLGEGQRLGVNTGTQHEAAPLLGCLQRLDPCCECSDVKVCVQTGAAP
jgi:hypothetical protein